MSSRFGPRGLISLLAFLVVAAPLLMVLERDPAAGFTFSTSPFTDEGFHAVNARNLVLFGNWGSDDWQLQLVQWPYSALVAGMFAVFGPGLLPLRLLSAGLLASAAAVLAGALVRPIGRSGAAVAVVALAACPLVLYYGRLGYAETLTSLAFVAGFALVIVDGRHDWTGGFAGGLLFGVAIASRQNAAFAVGACLLGALVGGAAFDPSARRRIAAAVAGIGFVGLAWAVLVWLPNRSAFGTVVTDILPPFHVPMSPRAAVAAVRYFLETNDRLGGALGATGATAVAGLLAVVVTWRRRTPEARRIAAAAVGSIVGGIGIMALVRYHPNRYAVSVVPAFAILAGLGVWSVEEWVRSRWPGSPDPASASRRSERPSVRPPLSAAIGPVVALAIVAVTVLGSAGLILGPDDALPTIQAAYAATVPPGSVVVGPEAPTFAMTARARTIVTETGTVAVNAGDLYASAGARWWVVSPTDVPEVARSHPAAWAARHQVRCDSWGGGVWCLYELP